MKAILFFLTLVFSVNTVLSCDIACLPDDEFSDLDALTTEWNSFMDQLIEMTFDEKILQCINNQSQNIVVNADSDIVWEMRYKLYENQLDESRKTLRYCYCTHQDCENEELRLCLAEARKNMEDDVNGLNAEISNWAFSEAFKC